MIIINADDWGESRKETDSALSCYREGRISSVSAMVFMDDSGRAAELAKSAGLDVGLHVNFSQSFTGECGSEKLRTYHNRLIRFFTFTKYAVLFYNPLLVREFRYVYEAQVKEFLRLYGRPPSHIDGHRHQHLCANMLLNRIIPEGEKVRRSFSFWPGEKGLVNRTYRQLVDRCLERRYCLTDFFFALSHCLRNDRLTRAAQLSKSATVELMTHTYKADEYAYLMSETHREMLRGLELGTYSAL